MSEVVGRYRRAYPRLFRHPGFRALTPLGQRLTVYLLFGPPSNRIGLFYFSVNTAAEDLDTTPETLRKALPNVQSAFGWMFDSTARVFYIPSWWRWNHPDHDKVLKGNLKDLSEIPPCSLVDAFATNVSYLSPNLHAAFFEAIRIRLVEPPRSQDHLSGSVKEQELAALRAGSDEKRPGIATDIPLQVQQAAREAVRDAPDHADVDYLVDAFHHVLRGNKSSLTRATIEAAIHNAQLERRRTW